MKVSLENIKFFNHKYGCVGDPMPDGIEALVEKINTQLGGVDEVIDFGAKYKDILIVKIVDCEKHPNADKLNVCKIDDGGVNKGVERDSNGYVQVVCGAPNARLDLITVWIPPSVVVPSTYGKDPLELEAREIRGQVSNGMLASPSELAISGDHNGIIEIDQHAEPGQTFADVFKLDDYIIDIENKMFTHRPDLFGMMGVAREIAGIQGQSYKSPDWYLTPLPIDQASELHLTVENQIPELAPRFMAVAMSGIEVKPSPLWLQINLVRVGIKPINNIVDLTNYFMMLTAQPLHAYDYDKVKALSGGDAKIVVRSAKAGEKIKLLGGKVIEPKTADIMIATDKQLIGIGGVMGGADTEIDASTKNIILECANFDMYAVRRTSMSHGLFTDASTRFTKGQSPLQCPSVFAKVIDDIKRIVGGQVAGSVVDVHKELSACKSVEVSADNINKLLGSKFTADQIAKTLKNTEFDLVGETDQINSEYFNILPPFWRTDIEILEDVAEEVGRLYGFNKLPKSLPTRTAGAPQLNPKIELKNIIRKTMANLGANEVLTYNFVHGKLLAKAGQAPDNSFKLRNALSPDLEYYRQTITPSILDKVHPNIKSGHDQFVLFEIGKSHNLVHGKDSELPGELEMLALTYANQKPAKTDGSAYFHARNYLDQLMASFGFTLEYKTVGDDMVYPVTSAFDFKRSALASIVETGTFVGIVGEYKQEVAKQFKLPDATAGFEIGIAHILEALDKKTTSSYKPLGRFPSTTQDVTINTSANTNYNDLLAGVASKLKASEFGYQILPVSIYQPDNSPQKSTTFRITLSHAKRTLTTEEVNILVKSLID